ncbi:MAG: hypothetical protein NC299_16715 [Lachnospiraceae bacterium]|nr:hypothetical protein [Lachnospiraceae bacterium]
MLINEFRTAHKAETLTLPFDRIFLTENVHVKGLVNGDAVNNLSADPVLIIRRVDEHRYALVSGYNAYITALMNHIEQVKAVVVPDKSRNAFFKRLPFIVKMNTSDIKAPEGWTRPREEKINGCIERYKVERSFGKNIIVDKHNTVLDGYAAVVAAGDLGVKEITVSRVSAKEWEKSHKKKKFSKTP